MEKLVIIQPVQVLNCLTGKPAKSIWETSLDHYRVDLWAVYEDGLQSCMMSQEYKTERAATNAARSLAKREGATLRKGE